MPEENNFSSVCFFQQDGCMVAKSGSRSTRKPTAAAQTHVLHVCAEVACSWCSALVALAAQECSGLQISGHIASRSPAFAPQEKNTFFPSTHHNIQRLQALGVLLRSGSIGLGLTFLARLMVVLRAERGRGVFEVASEKRDARETAEPAPLCIANSAPLQNICMH